MAHPRRDEIAKRLAKDLDMPCRVIWDDSDNEWETGKRAWEVGLGEGADYHLVIQDDAIPCHDFGRLAAEAAHWAAGHPVSFYTGAGRPYGSVVGPAVQRALKTGRPWISMRGPIWGVAVALPTENIKPFLAAAARMDCVYDERLGRFYHENDRPCFYTVPSLVDHRQLPSLVEDHDLPGITRRAYAWEDFPADINWNSLPLRIGDPNQPFRADGNMLICSACGHETPLVPEMAEHVNEDHGCLDRLDYFALDAESAEIFSIFYYNTPKSIRGNFWVLGKELRDVAGGAAHWTTKETAARTLRTAGEFPIVVSSSAAFPYIGARPVISMDGHECPTDLIIDHPGVKAHA